MSSDELLNFNILYSGKPKKKLWQKHLRKIDITLKNSVKNTEKLCQNCLNIAEKAVLRDKFAGW